MRYNECNFLNYLNVRDVNIYYFIKVLQKCIALHEIVLKTFNIQLVSSQI